MNSLKVRQVIFSCVRWLQKRLNAFGIFSQEYYKQINMERIKIMFFMLYEHDISHTLPIIEQTRHQEEEFDNYSN
jgi:hypothetical protein